MDFEEHVAESSLNDYKVHRLSVSPTWTWPGALWPDSGDGPSWVCLNW